MPPAKPNPYDQLKRIVASRALPATLLILCPDIVRRKRALEYLLSNIFKDAALRKLTVQHYSGEELKPDQIDDLASTFRELSLFVQHRVFAIRDCQELEAASVKSLTKLLASASQNNSVVLSSAPLPAKHELIAVLKDSPDSIVRFEELEGEDLDRWALQELKRCGLTKIGNGVSRYLIQVAKGNVDLLAAMIDYLALYCEGEEVRLPEAQSLFSYLEEVDEFELIDLISRSRSEQLVELTDRFMQSRKSLFPTVALLARMYSNYLRVKLGIEKGLSQDAIAKDLGSSPWAVRKQAQAAAKLSHTQLVRGLVHILRADSLLKNRSLGERVVFEELVSRLSRIPASI